MVLRQANCTVAQKYIYINAFFEIRFRVFEIHF